MFKKENILYTKILCRNERELKRLWHVLHRNNIKESYINNYEEKYNSLYLSNFVNYNKDEAIWFMICWGYISSLGGDYHFFFRMNQHIIDGKYDDEISHSKKDKYKIIKYNDIINYNRIKKLNRILKK